MIPVLVVVLGILLAPVAIGAAVAISAPLYPHVSGWVYLVRLGVLAVAVLAIGTAAVRPLMGALT